LVVIDGDGVVAAADERVATQDAARGEPGAAERAELLIGLDGVATARRFVAALAAQEGGEGELVEADGRDEREGGEGAEGHGLVPLRALFS
jgi:hypothetical protein